MSSKRAMPVVRAIGFSASSSPRQSVRFDLTRPSRNIDSSSPSKPNDKLNLVNIPEVYAAKKEEMDRKIRLIVKVGTCPRTRCHGRLYNGVATNPSGSGSSTIGCIKCAECGHSIYLNGRDHE